MVNPLGGLNHSCSSFYQALLVAEKMPDAAMSNSNNSNDTFSKTVGINKGSYVLTTVDYTAPSTSPAPSSEISRNVWKVISEIPASKSIQVPSQNQN
jgi:hypothetical protein